MALVADVRENTGSTGNYPKYVGYFESEVVAINPTSEEYFEIYGSEPKENQIKYLRDSTDGIAAVDIVVHLREVKTGKMLQLRFWLKDKKRVGSQSNKKQYINTIGKTGWAFDEDNLPQFFLKDGRDYRQAYEGEEEFVKFLRTWLGNLNFNKPEAVLQLDWKKVIVGNLKEWKELVGHEWTTTVGCLATVKLKDNEDGSTSAQQSVFNKSFFAGYNIKNLRLFDWTKDDLIRSIKFKKDLKGYEYFIKDVTGEYGPKEVYTLTELTEYDPSKGPENEKIISEEDSVF